MGHDTCCDPESHHPDAIDGCHEMLGAVTRHAVGVAALVAYQLYVVVYRLTGSGYGVLVV